MNSRCGQLLFLMMVLFDAIVLVLMPCLVASAFQTEKPTELKEAIQALSKASMKIGESLSQQSGGGDSSSSTEEAKKDGEAGGSGPGDADSKKP